MKKTENRFTNRSDRIACQNQRVPTSAKEVVGIDPVKEIVVWRSAKEGRGHAVRMSVNVDDEFKNRCAIIITKIQGIADE